MFKTKHISFLGILVIFILLYNPPIIQVNTVIMGGVISYIYIFFNYKLLKKRTNIKEIILFYGFFIIISLYLFVSISINGQEYSNMAFFIYIILFVFPMGIMLSVIFIKRALTMEQILNLFIISGTLQSFISLFALANPTFQYSIINRIVELGYSSVWLNITDHRLYGFSDGLTYSMPIVQGVLAILSVFMFFEYNRKYILYFPFLAFSGVINGRISVVIMSIGLFLISIYFLRNIIDKFLKIVAFLFLFSAIGIIGILILQNLLPSVYFWIETGVNDIVTLFKGDTSEGYFAYLTNTNNRILPYKISNKLFGSGKRIMEGNYVTSDIGYINDIWLGGYVYAVLIYSLTFRMSFYVSKINNEAVSNFLAVYFMLSMVFANFKGTIIGLNGLYAMFLVLFIYSVLTKD